MPTGNQARNTEVGQQLIELVRGLIVEELDAREARTENLGDYDEAACTALAKELGVNSLNRAGDFFGKLALDGEADSLVMGVHLGVGSPRNISSAITTPVKRVTKRLGLELPWTEDENSEGRTVWRDRDGIAARMRVAVGAEQHRRATAT
jgi:hypothetical protein